MIVHNSQSLRYDVILITDRLTLHTSPSLNTTFHPHHGIPQTADLTDSKAWADEYDAFLGRVLWEWMGMIIGMEECLWHNELVNLKDNCSRTIVIYCLSKLL